MAKLSQVAQRLVDLGKGLGFDVLTEVEASESAWVDVVWFDKRLPVGPKKPKMRYAPVLPVAAFEIELQTGLNAKHVKGSVSNLSNLSALLGVVVIGQQSLDLLRKQTIGNASKTSDQLEQMLRDRVYRWVYAEAQPRTRVIVMFEHEVSDWAKRLGYALGS
jgi:hypothetical protein